MLNDFYTVTAYRQTESGITCNVSFNAADPIFKGHFPEQPIVPGVCTMHIVKALLEAALSRKLTLKESSAVKFLRLITPASTPHVLIDWQDDAGLITASATLRDGGAAVFKMNAVYGAPAKKDQ